MKRPAHIRRPVACCAVLILLALAFPPLSVAQTGESSPPPQSQADDATSNADVSTGEGTVEVDEEPSDARIENRITKILTATQRFESLRVEVRDGVVFLAGVADREDLSLLATDLAKRTEGVAAVVNNLTIRKDPTWSLAPARAEVETLLKELIRALPLILVGLVLVICFFLGAGFVGRLAGMLISRVTDSVLLRNVVQKAVVLTVMIFGVYLALRITGLTRIALAVVSGTGLIGLALGFAFRDIAENFLASILLSIQRPFRLGDVISVDGHTGVVRKVTSRGTLLIDFDGNHIQIANSTVYKNTIKNMTANPKLRVCFTVGVGYDARLSQAQQVASGVLESHPAVLDDPEPLVLIDSISSSGVNLRLYFWIDSNEHSQFKVKSAVIRLTLDALDEAGISMPDEAREVIFPQGVPVQMLDGAADQPGATDAEEPERQTPDAPIDAEDDLSTEVHDLNKQADESRDPEVGPNVLQDSPPE